MSLLRHFFTQEGLGKFNFDNHLSTKAKTKDDIQGNNEYNINVINNLNVDKVM